MQYFITAIACLFTCTVIAQSQQGRIIDRESGIGIPYVNVGLMKKGDGITSDNNGYFNFDLAKTVPGDSISFSCIGYKALVINAYNLNKDTNKIIYLDKHPATDKVVQPLTGNFKIKGYGHTTQSSLITMLFWDIPAAEHGTIISFKKPVVLQTIIANMAKMDTDSIYCRINIYKFTGNMQFENILKKPLYYIASKKEFNDQLILDVSGENIAVQGNYLFSIQNLFMDNKSRNIALKGTLAGHSYSRFNPNDAWEKSPFGLAIWVRAKLPVE
jgi:hypothetical protein